MDLAEDSVPQEATTPVPTDDADNEASQKELALVKKIATKIRQDKKFHEKAFERMRRDMFVALHGRTDDWSEKSYSANITGRHINTKVAALYAKNPKAVARRRETLDFALWDESPDSLMLAYQTVMQAQQMMAMQPPMVDEMGMPVQPELPPGVMEAQQLIDDFTQGMQRRQMLAKLGKTLEIVFAHQLRDQRPVDFKTSMKQLVRRACTTGVGYIEIGFERSYGKPPQLMQQLADDRMRLDHLQSLAAEAVEGEYEDDAAEIAELEAGIAAIEAGPDDYIEVEKLVFDFPQSTKVIPDKLTKNLVGFVGARHVTIEYLFTKQQVEEMFNVDLGNAYVSYGPDGKKLSETNKYTVNEFEFGEATEQTKNDMVCVYKTYDRMDGVVYYTADGYGKFLRPPGPPDVQVEDFWPVYALTFNEVESEKELFPPSDVTLMLPMQQEYNRSRQGMREHRANARPRFVFSTGILDEEDIAQFQQANAHDAIALNVDASVDIAKVLQPVPYPGVDPNLYETGQLFTDIQIVVGTQEAILGGVAKGTATESSIAASSTQATIGDKVDDLDGFLTRIARVSSQILLREMSPERVSHVVGPGAVWPDMSEADLVDEIFLEVEAGSSGKPNQAVEINNWERLLPSLLQMPTIQPMWLARETLRRLDDKLDLTEAIVANIPAIVAQNRASIAGPGGDPAAQGPEGADNAPAPDGGPSGSDAPMGASERVIQYDAQGAQLG